MLVTKMKQTPMMALLLFSLVVIGVVIDDVEYKIPIAILIGQTIVIFIAAYLDGQREDEPNWIYAGVVAYCILAFFFVFYNYFSQF